MRTKEERAEQALGRNWNITGVEIGPTGTRNQLTMLTSTNNTTIPQQEYNVVQNKEQGQQKETREQPVHRPQGTIKVQRSEGSISQEI